MIERAGPEAASAVHALMGACAAAMRRQGFHNWDAPPPPERLAAWAAERALLVVRPDADAAHAVPDGGLAGAVFVGPAPLRPYDAALAAGEVRWAVSNEPNGGPAGGGPAGGAPAAYVNALAVHPAQQGRGLGAALMRAAEREARAWGARAVRLDALEANAALLDFYARLGYAARGRRTHGGWTFTCLEKPVPDRT